MDIFWGSSQYWAVFGGNFYAFWGLFLRSRYRIWILFLVAKISKLYLLGYLKFLIFLGVKGRCRARAYV